MPFKFLCPSGAGAIELAEWRGHVLPKFLTAGARGHNRIYGAPVKKIKRLMKSQIFSKGSVQRVIPWQRTHSSTALSITLCFMSAQTADTASVRRHQSIDK